MDWKLEDYKDVLFGDFEKDQKDYLKLSKTDALIPRLDECLDLFNTENSPMNLVFFGDCI
jgi:hypothetical protein